MSMSTNEGTIEFVRERAAHWAVRMSEGDLSEPELAGFQRWLLEDARHADEFRAQNSIIRVAQELPRAAVERLSVYLPEDEVTSQRTPLWGRRRVMAMAAGVMLAAVAAGWLSFRTNAPATSFATNTGEMRDVTFADGSVAHMNTRTRLEWLGDVEDRRVRMIEGEALFDVVHDASRPFRVLLDNSEIQVVGTSFNIYRKRSGDTVVSVLDGKVRVRGRGQAWERELEAGERLVYRNIGPSDVELTRVSDAIQWREGVLEMTGKPLAEIVDELNRYTDQPIVIRDSRLAATEMGGVLDVRDVRGALSRIEKAEPQIVVGESNGVYTLDRRPKVQ